MSMNDPEADEKYRPKEFAIGRLRLVPWQEWSQFFDRERHKRYNWHDMHLVMLHLELAHYKETFEINACVLGLGICVEWSFGKKNEP